MNNLDLTGQIRYRRNIFGMLIVQVEYMYQYSYSEFNENDAENRYAWMDATAEHLNMISNSVPVV